MSKITIIDIARELGLSRNTVAKALNNSEVVAPETRRQIVEKAMEMGYQKLSATVIAEFGTTAKQEVKTVLVMARRELSVFWNSIILGISDEINSRGWKLRICFISAEDEAALVLPSDYDEQIDAIILMSVFNKPYRELIMKAGLPAVYLDSPIITSDTELEADAIVCEGRNAVRKLTDSLIAQGIRDIGFIGDINYCESVKQRYDGYAEAMNSASIPLDRGVIATSGEAHRFYIAPEIERALEGFSHIPEGIVCANDFIALTVIRILKKKGLEVPADVAVTGFDNEEKLTAVDPVLTTVEVRNQALGRRLVKQLIFRMENPGFPREFVYISTKTIYRQSSVK